MRYLLVLALAVLLGRSSLHAEEKAAPGPQPLLQTLPAEGSWITYFVTIRIGDDEHQPEWRAASVGRGIVDGKPCRWIELSAKEDDYVFTVYKALVPESAFGPGRNPLRAAKVLWVREHDEKPRRINGMREIDPYMDLILSGPVSNVAKLKETETVRWQKGNLECEVWVGTNKLDTPLLKLDNSQRLLRHASIPFGVAGSHVKLNDGLRTADVEFVLTGFGRNAKSLLPDVGE